MTAAGEWVLTVRLLPPATPVRQLPADAQCDIDLYERVTGPVEARPDGDDELFLEDVARLAAVHRHVDDHRVWIRSRCRGGADGAWTGGGMQLTNLATGAPFTGDESTLFRWGPLTRDDEAWNPHPAETAASSYHLIPAFHAHAGRKTALADATSESLDAAVDAVRGDSGKVVVKVNRRKYAVITLDVAAHENAHDAITASEELLLTLIHLEGDRDAYLVQEHVEMTFERRYFVVDHVPVTSAGCIEEFHPYSRTAATRHDPRMRRHRHGRASSIIWAEEQTRQLTDFARTVADDIRRGPFGDELTEYVLDVALGPGGRPLIVELNGIRNSGLYAADCDSIVEQLARRPGLRGSGGDPSRPI